MQIRKPAVVLASGLVLVLVNIAQAHPGHGVAGIAAGIAHPFSGIDHLLAMIAVGIWAAQQGGKARWCVPLSFLGFMVLGGVVGFQFPQIPFADTAVATTVLLLGLLIATATRLPLAAGILLTGVFALCHGYAHGSELPAAASALTFSVGFILATATLHGIGLILGTIAQRTSNPKLVRASGIGIAMASILIFASLI